MKRARERHARPREITKRFDEVLKGLASHDPDTRPRPAAAGFLDRIILPPLSHSVLYMTQALPSGQSRSTGLWALFPALCSTCARIIRLERAAPRG